MSDIELSQPTAHPQETSLENKEILKGLATAGFGGEVQIDFTLQNHMKTTRSQQQKGLCALDSQRQPYK